MVGLIQDCMDGLALTDSVNPSERAVDFILAGPNEIFWTEAHWWLTQWELGFGLNRGRGDLTKTPYGWRLERPDVSVLFGPIEDEKQQARFERARISIDVERAAYLKQLQLLRDNLGADWYKAVDEWITAVNDRAPMTPQEAYARKHAALRTVGIVRVTDEHGVLEDALALDELGNAAAVREHSWLASIGSQWRVYAPDERPALKDFLGWVAGQMPGGLNVEEPKIIQAEGFVEVLAIQNGPR